MDKTNSANELSLPLLDDDSSPALTPVSSGEDSGARANVSRGRSMLQHPLEKTIPPSRNGLAQGKILRNGNEYLLYLQAPEDKEHLLYKAEKKSSFGKAKYVIRACHKVDIVGRLQKTKTGGTNVSYALRSGGSALKETEEQELLSIQYQVPSVIQVLSDGPARHAHVSVSGRDIVETKEPYSKGGGQRGLNFGGRGREPSRKNMQLQDKDGKVVLQMVKWEKDQFHLDFA